MHADNVLHQEERDETPSTTQGVSTKGTYCYDHSASFILMRMQAGTAIHAPSLKRGLRPLSDSVPASVLQLRVPATRKEMYLQLQNSLEPLGA